MPRTVRLHPFVGADGAGASELDSGVGRELYVGLEAGGDHDHIGGEIVDGFDCGAEVQLDAVLLRAVCGRRR